MPTIGTITVDMSKLSAAVRAQWYDPTSGTYSSIAGSPFANAGTQQFTPPGNNSAGDGDWALVLEVSTVEAYTISVTPGWNLISLPLQPPNPSIATVLARINGAYEAVWAYPNQTWKVYDPNDTAGNTLTNMQAGDGYWIKMTSAKTLSVAGSAPSSSLFPGGTL
jgi:hypothetical protein